MQFIYLLKAYSPVNRTGSPQSLYKKTHLIVKKTTLQLLFLYFVLSASLLLLSFYCCFQSLTLKKFKLEDPELVCVRTCVSACVRVPPKRFL